MSEKTDDSMGDAHARGNVAGPLSPLRSEGQRAMRMVPGSLSAIAGAVGVDKGTVSRWRSGEKVPNGPMRQRLHSLYAIAPESWDRSPHGAPKPQSAAPVATSSPEAGASVLAETLSLIESLKDQLQDPGLTSSERKGVTDNLGKMLALRARLEEKGEMMEARIVREHPRWRDILRGLPDVLRPFPAAAEAVQAWLAELEEA